MSKKFSILILAAVIAAVVWCIANPYKTFELIVRIFVYIGLAEGIVRWFQNP